MVIGQIIKKIMTIFANFSKLYYIIYSRCWFVVGLFMILLHRHFVQEDDLK